MAHRSSVDSSILLGRSICIVRSFLTSSSPLTEKPFSDRRWQSNIAGVDGLDYTKREQYESAKFFREIPGPKGLPYLGTLLQYRLGPYRIETYHEALLDRYRKYGKIFKETIAGQTTVHLFDPSYAQLMYQSEGKQPHITPLLDTIQMYRKHRNMSPGLGNTNGEEWYRLRSAAQRLLLTPKSVTTFLPHVNQVADDFLRRIDAIKDPESGCVSNLQNELSKWNIESCGAACFETRLGCLKAEDSGSWQQQMIDANATMFRISSKLKFSLPLYKFFPTTKWKTLLEMEDYFYSKGQKLVNQTFENVKKLMDSGQAIDGKYSVMTYLMGRKELSYNEISVIVLSLFTDGLSTTTPSLLGQLYCLSVNPDKQDRLYDEVMKLAPNRNEAITDDILQQASYLKACIKEGFRFFPIGPDVSRVPQKDIAIGGYQIPAGTEVSLNSNLLLRLSEYFDNPDKYLPDRWIRGGSAQNVHPYLLLPFGHGPRTCAGMRFAEQEMRVLMMKLLQNFRIVWKGKKEETMSQKYVVLFQPNIASQFQFIPRN